MYKHLMHTIQCAYMSPKNTVIILHLEKLTGKISLYIIYLFTLTDFLIQGFSSF